MLVPVQGRGQKMILRCLEVVEDSGDGPFINVAALLMELMKRNGSRVHLPTSPHIREIGLHLHLASGSRTSPKVSGHF